MLDAPPDAAWPRRWCRTGGASRSWPAGAPSWPAPLAGGGRLLVAGNGGSAAEAQHLTAELVGKLRDDRQPLSAIALHAETVAR